jgi:tetratricopeptide (TPR) repeat protein
MKWSLRIARIDGTDIKIHWSFVLVIPYFLNLVRPDSLGGVLLALAVLLLLFTCIALHELGHSVVAGRLGIPTRSIVLWPLGGFALLSRAPERPLHQLAIYGAGPLVNLLLAGLLFLAERALPGSRYTGRNFWSGGLTALEYVALALPAIAYANLGLALFNLIPAYPLDGGRILRALLLMLLSERLANLLMLGLSWLLVVALIVFGATSGDWLLLLVALIIFAGAGTLNRTFTTGINQGFVYLADRGAFHIQRGDYDAGIAYYNRAISAKPKRAQSYNNRGYGYFRKKQYDRAITDYNRAIQLDPELGLAYVNRAYAYNARGDHERAIADFQHLTHIQPQNETLYEGIGYIAMHQYDFDRALAAYQQAIQLVPASVPAHIGSGFCYLERNLGREDDRVLASAALDRVFQTSPNETDIYHGRGTLAVLDGDYERALAEYNYAISLSTKSALCFAQRGEIFRALGQAQLASQDYDTAIALDPEHDDAYLYRSMLHYNQGDLASATADWERAYACGPQGALVHSELWLQRHIASNLAWAAAYHSHLARLRPDDPLVYRGRADAYRINGEHALALADYNRALELAPEHAEARFGRGIALHALGQPEQARADFARVLEQSDNATLRRWAGERLGIDAHNAIDVQRRST